MIWYRTSMLSCASLVKRFPISSLLLVRQIRGTELPQLVPYLPKPYVMYPLKIKETITVYFTSSCYVTLFYCTAVQALC